MLDQEYVLQYHDVKHRVINDEHRRILLCEDLVGLLGRSGTRTGGQVFGFRFLAFVGDVLWRHAHGAVFAIDAGEVAVDKGLLVGFWAVFFRVSMLFFYLRCHPIVLMGRAFALMRPEIALHAWHRKLVCSVTPMNRITVILKGAGSNLILLFRLAHPA